MPKLKLTGRKLCTSGRKLAVCGCGGPCCSASFPCEITPSATPRQFKTWWNVTASGKRVVSAINPQTTPPPSSCVGGNFGGTYSGTNTFAQLTQDTVGNGPNNSFELGNTACQVNRIVQNQSLFTTSGTVTGNLSLGGFNSSYAQHAVSTLLPQSGGGWAFQPSVTDVNPAKEIRFRWDISASSLADIGLYREVGSSTVGIEVRVLNGVVTLLAFGQAFADSISAPSFGTATPFLVVEGNCILGAGATFSYTVTRLCNVLGGPNESLGPISISGSVATALCGLAVGCVNPGSVCGSTSVPGAGGGGGGGGAATLDDQLDAALFS